ncbi:glucose 1-dehydrogenase [Nocardia farcinica]|uniref:glucose 1-dehydrogenase n=1 Tax=Nocardia farcinica TaxID=37329 RepID=UPI002457FA7B|nr:glucose 1-dehydrogenase [Nocardia farcinica]
MRAITVQPGRAGSVQVEELPDPVAGTDELLVRGVALGVCGTDKEIGAAEYGWAPPGRDRLVLGHESLGRVVQAPPGSGFAEGELVAGVVRRPDPVPCGACAHGEFDMCRNGRYRERGIKELDGFGSELWTVETDYAVRVDPELGHLGVLLEPASVLAKAWEQIERIGGRSWFEPRTVLVTGAGPIGLLAALMGVQRALEVHVLDRVTDGPKPALVRGLGATYHHGDVAGVIAETHPDVVIEATGVSALVVAAMAGTAHYGITCLTGVSTGGRPFEVDTGGLNRSIVLENDVVVGSVNANQRHYRAAADALAAAAPAWLAAMITRRVPLERAVEAFGDTGDEVKVVIDLE